VRLAADDGAQLGGAGRVRPAVEHGLDLGGRGAVEHAGFVAGAGEAVELEHRCEVDEGSGNRGRGNTPDGGGVSLVHVAAAPGRDSFDAPFGWGDDLERRR
jgi:hypothetical protein